MGGGVLTLGDHSGSGGSMAKSIWENSTKGQGSSPRGGGRGLQGGSRSERSLGGKWEHVEVEGMWIEGEAGT